jgi:amidase
MSIFERPFKEIEEMTIAGWQERIKNGETSIVKITSQYLERIRLIDKTGPELNSVIYVNPNAVTEARLLDEEFLAGQMRSPLHGMPVLLKDNIDTADMPTTAGSRALAGSIPPDDAFITRKLREAGVVILGKANLSEWANFRGENSTSGWSGLGGLSKNPYKLDRNTCGSSAGSGAAVAANLCMLAIGTETNGSIVCPSSTNGIVGIKPTVGLISRDGIIPISSTQDTSGPMARTVRDAAIGLSVMTGTDPADSATVPALAYIKKDYSIYCDKDALKGKKIGRGFTDALQQVSSEVYALALQAIEDMKALGAEVVDIPSFDDPSIAEDSFNVMLFEYKEGLNNYLKSLGPKAPITNIDELIEFNKKDNVELQYFGQEYLLQAAAKGDLNTPEYKDALARMLAGRRENGIDKVMDEHGLSAIIAPTNSPAWKTDLENGDKFLLGSSSPAAQAGYPNITVPMGFADDLPVGMSFYGRAWSEDVLIGICYAYEQYTKHRKAPQFLRS